jgi:hypothetical protein
VRTVAAQLVEDTEAELAERTAVVRLVERTMAGELAGHTRQAAELDGTMAARTAAVLVAVVHTVVQQTDLGAARRTSRAAAT